LSVAVAALITRQAVPAVADQAADHTATRSSCWVHGRLRNAAAAAA
jgi:hypothetical protein